MIKKKIAKHRGPRQRAGLAVFFTLVTGLLFMPLPVLSAVSPPQKEQRLNLLQPYLGTSRHYPLTSMPEAPAQCELIHISWIGRHGSRYPLKLDKVTHSLDNLTAALAGHSLTPWGEDFLHRAQRFVTWLKDNPDRLGQLTPLGIIEQQKLGEAVAKTLHAPSYKTINATVANSDTDRTRASQKAFIEGLQQGLPETAQLNISTAMESQDANRLLRPKHNSEALQSWKKKSQSLVRCEQNAAVKQHIQVAQALAQKMAKNISVQQASEILLNSYQLCSNNNPIGDPFGLCQQLVDWTHSNNWQPPFALANTMTKWRQFYEFGPNRHLAPINKKLISPLLNWLLTRTEIAANGGSPYQLEALFSHDSTLAMLLQILEFEPDTGSDRERYERWAGPNELPMAANISWQLYRCSNPGEEPQLKVSMQLNERSVKFPISACENQVLCDWNTVYNHYKKNLNRSTESQQPAGDQTRLSP